MALVETRVAAGKTLSTQKITSGFGRNAGKVVWRSDLERRLGVTWAAKVQVRPHIAVFSKDVQYLSPHRDMRGGFCVANDIHSVLSSR